jgi:hypothetical protein
VTAFDHLLCQHTAKNPWDPNSATAFALKLAARSVAAELAELMSYATLHGVVEIIANPESRRFGAGLSRLALALDGARCCDGAIWLA